MEEVIRVLLPEFRVVHSLGAALDAENEALHRLTSEQIAFFEGLSGNRRLLVDGVAGSGKTVLARETAKRLAAEGARVLLCCFNIPLAETLREQLEGAERIDVVHFHGLCERVVTATGGRWEVPPPPNSTFFNETAAELLLDALPGYPERYDALVVDEGQDFQEAWWVALVQLLRDPAAGHVIVFHDPRQNIYGRSGAPSLEAIPYTLTVNCRNTVAIARVVHAIGRVRARTSVGAAEGEAPVVREVADDAAEREAVRKILDELVNRGGLPTRRIVILGAHKFERSPFAENAKLGRFTVRDMSAEGRPDGSPEDGEAVIRYCTLHRFKGLEEDCVILGGIGMKGWQPTMPELYRAMLYVAASRARVRLFLLHRPGSGLGEMMRGDAGTL
jgi:superfamily I DNA/RNA helicase